MYKEKLIERLPEAYQDNPEMIAYLEAAGELFDEFTKSIVDFDTYRDPATIRSDRIKDLAYQVGMNFPRNIDEMSRRKIMRDIHSLYSRVGVKKFSEWLFRLLDWDASVELAWLPNPQHYDPSIADIHSIDAPPPKKSPDFRKADHRIFYIGESYIETDGSVYFRGRTFFDEADTITIDKLEIVGEEYDIESKERTIENVSATPYIYINVRSDEYGILPTSYVYDSTGDTFEFGSKEQFEVVQNIINFFIYDEFRPSHVKVVVMMKTDKNASPTVVYDDVDLEPISKPVSVSDKVVLIDDHDSRLDHVVSSSDFFLSGIPPSPFGRKMVLAPFDEETITPEATVGGEEFTFYTPDMDSHDFRRVFHDRTTFYSSQREVGNVFEEVVDDDPAISLEMDIVADLYGVSEDEEPAKIIIREPTTISSENFNSVTPPEDEYMVGTTDDGGETFAKDALVSFNIRDKKIEADIGEKTFTYYYDMDVLSKDAVQNPDWQFLLTNPVVGNMINMTSWNEVLFLPKKPLGFDLIVDVKYLPQPQWDNDPRHGT